MPKSRSPGRAGAGNRWTTEYTDVVIVPDESVIEINTVLVTTSLGKESP
jgi:hypothetical protein